MIVHTSPSKIESVHETELFGYGLFFSGSGSVRGESYEYSIDKDQLKIASICKIGYEIEEENPIVSAFARRWELGYDDAEAAILERINLYDLLDCEQAGLAVHEAQGALLKLAVSFGFDAVETNDEFGVSYIVDGRVAIKKWQLEDLS